MRSWSQLLLHPALALAGICTVSQQMTALSLSLREKQKLSSSELLLCLQFLRTPGSKFTKEVAYSGYSHTFGVVSSSNGKPTVYFSVDLTTLQVLGNIAESPKKEPQNGCSSG